MSASPIASEAERIVLRRRIDEETRARQLPERRRMGEPVQEPPPADAVREAARKPVVAGKICKTDGCDAEANARWDRGLFHGLCWDHVEVRRAEASARMREVVAARRCKQGDAAVADHAAPVEPPAAATLAELGQSLLDTRAALRAADAEFRDAAARLLSHPAIWAIPETWREALIP